MTIEDEARAEAEKRYAMEQGAGYQYPRDAVVTMMRGAFIAGAEWHASRPVSPQEPSEAEVEAVVKAHWRPSPWLNSDQNDASKSAYRETVREILETARTARGEQHG